MNKKFLSAILFGALMVTSTGTFVSCKDYDDDIDNLQTQIDKNSTAIAELQKLVGAGNWVTNIAGSEAGLVVTMNNGSSVTVPTVNGKNGTEWTIGEDGYWYKDGEKTNNVAVGKDGISAPSPKIENGYWVVYNWDAEKGEFVAETTDVPAAGTSSYVVLKNGVYTLFIADENGEVVEISLPAAADSFTVNGIANVNVKVYYTYGEWETPSTKKGQELFEKLAAEFPELKEYEDKDFVAQGGRIPFIVSPASVELTKDHTFALINLQGKDAEATLSNPAMGMPEGVSYDETDKIIESRSAEGTAVWSVDFVPALNKKGNGYKPADGLYSLVVGDAKGVIAATPYIYTYVAAKAGDLTLPATTVVKLYNEEGMDILTALEGETKYDLYYENSPVMKGKYIIEATDPAQVERYGISIEGSVVTIADMPKGQDVSGIDMKITAISVNGEVQEKPFELDVKQEIAATGALADMEVVLTGKLNKKGEFVNANQEIWWSLEELELSAMQMESFYSATKTLNVYRTEIDATTQEEVKVYAIKDAAITTLYKAAEATSTNKAKKYTEAKYFYSTIDVSTVIPEEYTVELVATTGTGTSKTTILKAESDLTLVNPEEDMLPIKETCLDEEGVVLAAAYANSDSKYYYNLNDIFSAVAGTKVVAYEDMDYEYDTEIGKWLSGTKTYFGYIVGAKMGKLEDGEFVAGDVDQVRTIKVVYNLFGNANNQMEKEIQVKWTSPVYAEDATDVITMTAAKLKIKFDDTTPATDANKVKFTAITSAVYAEGALKGQAYQFFTVENGREDGTAAKYDYSEPKTAGDYVLNSSGNIVTLTVEEYLAMCTAFNVTPNTTDYVDGEKTYKLKVSDWTAIWAVAANYYGVDGTGIYAKTQVDGVWVDKTVMVDDVETKVFKYSQQNLSGAAATPEALTSYLEADKAKMAIYTSFVTKIAFTKTDDATLGDKKYLTRAAEIKSVNFKLVNADDQNFLSTAVDATADQLSGFTLTAKASSKINKTALTSGKKVIPMQMIVTDQWGKVMTYEFEVEISL